MSENNLQITMRALGCNSRKADITVYRNGRIDICSRVSALIGLSAGDLIDVCSDGEEYYLYVSRKAADCVGRHEGRAMPANRRHYNGYGGSFRAYSRKITDCILKIAGGDKARILAGKQVYYDNIGKAVVIIPKFNLSTL